MQAVLERYARMKRCYISDELGMALLDAVERREGEHTKSDYLPPVTNWSYGEYAEGPYCPVGVSGGPFRRKPYRYFNKDECPCCGGRQRYTGRARDPKWGHEELSRPALRGWAECVNPYCREVSDYMNGKKEMRELARCAGISLQRRRKTINDFKWCRESPRASAEEKRIVFVEATAQYLDFVAQCENRAGGRGDDHGMV